MPAEVHWCQEGFRVSVLEPTVQEPPQKGQDVSRVPRILYLCTEEPMEPPNDCAPARDGRGEEGQVRLQPQPTDSQKHSLDIGMVQEEREMFSRSGCLEQISRAGDKACSLHP